MRKRSECTCECHRNGMVRHVVACCHEDDDVLFSVPINTELPTPQDLIGQTEAVAIQKINTAGMKYRVMQRDGESFMGTMDFDPTRFNLSIDNGIVTSVTMN
jgi:hypothetical protein